MNLPASTRSTGRQHDRQRLMRSGGGGSSAFSGDSVPAVCSFIGPPTVSVHEQRQQQHAQRRLQARRVQLQQAARRLDTL